MTSMKIWKITVEVLFLALIIAAFYSLKQVGWELFVVGFLAANCADRWSAFLAKHLS